MKIILIGIVLIFVVMFFNFKNIKKQVQERELYESTLSECELLDYKIERQALQGWRRNLLLEKQNLILLGECK